MGWIALFVCGVGAAQGNASLNQLWNELLFSRLSLGGLWAAAAANAPQEKRQAKRQNKIN